MVQSGSTDILWDLFPHVDSGLHLVTTFFVELDDFLVGFEDLKIDLDTAEMGQGLFGFGNELGTQSLMAK